MGTPDPCLTIKSELDIHIRFQYWCYSKQDPPPNQVKPIYLQVLRHIFRIATESVEPILMAECDTIIIVYFLILRPGEYKGSKSEITPLLLKDTAFIWGHIIFVFTLPSH